MKNEIGRAIVPPEGSTLAAADYAGFLRECFLLFARHPQYLAPGEDINCIELAHLLPAIPETVIAIYVGINAAVCNKGLIAPVLVRHGHNNVFVFDPAVFPGGNDVPAGTVDARRVLSGFEPPNATWNAAWTYVMVRDPARTFESLWRERGYIDMIPAKFEDFTMLSDPDAAAVCFFIDPKAFEHPVNAARAYLKDARRRGEARAREFAIPAGMAGEMEGLIPLVLARGEKLFVATADFSPCAHGWSNLHPDNREWAVVNENSAVPLDLVIAKPPVPAKYARGLRPPGGSADMTTDWFFRGSRISRAPLLQGAVKG